VTSIRFTLVDTSQTYDELLASVILDFLALIADPDLVFDHLNDIQDPF
jgi:cullin-associated NEDD8-dissociated protein 1